MIKVTPSNYRAELPPAMACLIELAAKTAYEVERCYVACNGVIEPRYERASDERQGEYLELALDYFHHRPRSPIELCQLVGGTPEQYEMLSKDDKARLSLWYGALYALVGPFIGSETDV